MILNFPVKAIQQEAVERKDNIRIEQGTLIVIRQQHYENGMFDSVELRVSLEDEIRLERKRHEQPEGWGDLNDPVLAYHLRMTAMPIIMHPFEGIDEVIDAMIHAVEKHENLHRNSTLAQVN